MAQDITSISNELPLADQQAQQNELLRLYAALQQQAASPANFNPMLEQQGANVRSADLSNSQLPIVQQLLGQGMTKGLSPDQFGGPSATGLTYSGGVAGYGGPPRAIDQQLNDFSAIKANSQQGYDAARAEQEMRLQSGPGGVPWGQILDKLAPALKAPEGVREPLVRALGIPGVSPISANESRLAVANIANGPNGKRYETALTNISQYYNKKTGQPASNDFPEGNPAPDVLANNYVRLASKDQRDKVDQLRSMDQQIANYQDLIGKLPLTDQKGMVNRLESGLSIKALRMANDENVRALDATKAQIIQLARDLGGTSKSADSIKELQRLEAAVINDFDSKAGAQTAIDTLKKFRDSKAQGVPIPGLRNRYANGGGVETPAQTQVQPQAPTGAPQPGAIIKGFRFKGGNPADKANWEPAQ